MRLWALLAALLLGTVVLAGCSDDGDGDDTDSTQTTSSGGTTTSATTTTTQPTSATTTTTQQNVPPPDEPENSAPFGSISAVPAVNILRTVNFTLDGGDPEGDNIVWDLFFGDGQAMNGAAFPLNVSHEYPANGTYNVSFSITDGRLQVNYNITVNSTATIAAPVGAGGAIVQSVSGSWQAGAFGCGAPYDAFPAEAIETSGGLFLAFAIEAASLGLPYTMTMTWDAPGGLGGEIAFYDAGGMLITNNQIAAGSPVVFTGTVPAGANHALASNCGAAGAAIEYAAG